MNLTASVSLSQDIDLISSLRLVGHQGHLLEMSGKESKTYMTPEAASRIQSSEARSNDGQVDKGSFASRAQSAGDTNVNKGYVPPRGSK